MKNLENKELYSFKFEEQQPVKDISVKEESLTIEFERDTFILTTIHEDDCCENVYAEFSVMDFHRYIISKYPKYSSFNIIGVPELGFVLEFYYDEENSNKVLIPCHNEQNGYYSTELILKIKRNDEPEVEIDIPEVEIDIPEVEIDIEECEQNHIF